jgi:phosphoserine aminotransferase
MATNRVFNFAAGPAVLPLPALEEAQRDLVALPGVGMSVLEISHRSKTFEAIIGECEANIRKLAGIPDNYHVLFLQGGATTQFSMVPMNLLPAGAWADYIVTGAWSQKAVKEAKKVGAVNVSFDDKAENYIRLPKKEELKLTKGAAYVHVTTNETIHGVEFANLPDLGDATVVADTSSHMFSRPIDVTKYGLIYAGAQKNIGPSGATLVIVRDDLVKKAAERPAYANLPVMLQYGTHIPEKSLYNTPP